MQAYLMAADKDLSDKIRLHQRFAAADANASFPQVGFIVISNNFETI
jgi:hypothetical protein